MTELPAALHGALELFQQEMSTHLGALDKSTARLSEAASGDLQGDWQKEKTTLQNRFHTIKGGAGFFQLTEIATMAAEGEKLAASLQSESELLEAARLQLPGIIGNLRLALQDLTANK